MAIGSLLQLAPFSSVPSPPPTGFFEMYILGTTIYLQDSFGNIYPFSSTTAISQLTGDVSAIGPGSAVATVNFVGGATAAHVASATAAYMAATSSDTPSTLVLRDSGGNFSAGVITATLNGNASTATFATTAGSATSFTGSLMGDVTGTQTATVVSYVDAYTAAQVGTSVAMTQAATSSNTASTLVLRDASGNFSANVITASLTGNVTGNLTGNVTGNVSGSSSTFTSPLSGDVTGNQTTTVVTAIQGSSVSIIPPTDAQILIYSSGFAKYIPQSLGGEATITNAGVVTLSTTAVTGKLLTGYTTGINTPINASNSILTAFENLQAQVSGTTGSAITALTGDVSATGPGSVTATVNSVGGATAAHIAAATAAYMAATSSDTPNTLVLRDGSGNFSAGTITATFIGNLTGNVTGNVSGSSSSFTGSLSGDITGMQSATHVSSIQGTVVSGTTGTTNVVFSASPTLTGTLNGNSAIFSSTVTASNISGTNTGDVTTTNTNSIDLAFTSGQTGLNATLNLSASGPDAGYIPAVSVIETDGLLVEVLAGTPVQVGTSNNIGSAASASRSDHVHAITSSVVLSLLLTGYTTGTNTPINATNTILQGFENLQAQISATTGSAITALTGDVTATGPGSVPSTVAKIQGNTVSGTTGTVNVVFSASPTFTGTVTTAAISATSLTDTSLTSGSVLYSGIGGLISQDNANFFWNDSTVALGLGTNSPQDVLHMQVSTTSATRHVLLDGYGTNGAGYRTRVAHGTVSSPTATQSGDTLGTFGALGYGASQFAASNTGALAIHANENFTNTSNATYVRFLTTPTGSVTASERMRINSTGNILVGTTTDNGQLLQVSGTAAISVSSVDALIVNSTSFIVDSVNNTIGIGTQPQTASVMTTLNTSGAAKPIWTFSYGAGSTTGLRGDFARGTVLSPAAAQAGDIMNFFSGRGYGATQFAATSTGSISVVAGETFTDTSNATYIAFKTTPTGSVANAERMRINSTGNILMDTTVDNGTDVLQIGSGLISSYSKLAGSTSGTITQQAAATTTSYTVNWPATQAASGSYLANDGAGNLSWSNPITNIDGGVANSVYTPSQFINGGTP